MRPEQSKPRSPPAGPFPPETYGSPRWANANATTVAAAAPDAGLLWPGATAEASGNVRGEAEPVLYARLPARTASTYVEEGCSVAARWPGPRIGQVVAASAKMARIRKRGIVDVVRITTGAVRGRGGRQELHRARRPLPRWAVGAGGVATVPFEPSSDGPRIGHRAVPLASTSPSPAWSDPTSPISAGIHHVTPHPDAMPVMVDAAREVGRQHDLRMACESEPSPAACASASVPDIRSTSARRWYEVMPMPMPGGSVVRVVDLGSASTAAANGADPQRAALS